MVKGLAQGKLTDFSPSRLGERIVQYIRTELTVNMWPIAFSYSFCVFCVFMFYVLCLFRHMTK